ncbi:MAG: nucleotidyl transferase AbiEii/AbiGii toxin family protein [Chthoniobacteraceae bacterium]
MEPSFEKLLARLADSGVRFILVGGLAVALHGYVRLTEDVDILLDSTDENLRRFLTCLADFGEGFARELSVADFTDEEGAIRIVEETEHCQIDVFTRMAGLRYADFAADAPKHRLGDRTLLYASKAALIRLKSASVREKDHLDVSALRRLEEDPRAFE